MTFSLIVMLLTTILVMFFLWGTMHSDDNMDYKQRYQWLLFLVFLYCLFSLSGDFIMTALTIDIFVIGCKVYITIKERG